MHHSNYPYRLCNVFDSLLPEVLIGERKLVSNLVVDSARNAYTAGGGEALQSCRDVHPVTIDGVFWHKGTKPAFQTSRVRLPYRKANLRKTHWLPNLRINGSGLGISPIWRRSYLSAEGEYRSHFLPESESEQHVINPRENNIEDFGMMVFGAICMKPQIARRSDAAPASALAAGRAGWVKPELFPPSRSSLLTESARVERTDAERSAAYQ